MKKIVCILALTCVVMGGAFAQAKAAAPAAPAPAAPAAAAKAPEPAAPAAKNAISLDFFPLFTGLIDSYSNDYATFSDFRFSTAYERYLVPHFSIGGNIEMYFLKMDYDAKGVDDDDGFYFSLAAEGRYYPLANFDKFFIGTTLGVNSFQLNGKKADEEHGGFSGLIVSLKSGYKVVLAKILFVEPSLSWALSKESGPNGWQGGLRFGVMF